ncbi:MAG: AbrB family transcriptional regulator [Halothiobacillus sp. 24-54-40]|jgi:antitoxin MazE|nr:MAG: AbrB family transcriptional regulator [Halothiobacillus sp. 20-54-6]OYY32843.1 MAG: AbrB family transcriptional regulator [Halothiobacillus sp. 35-54-62]OYZ85649.1 MAG: AbrB family transcriptional regulator [Halothiobacillus sp. 24-54-40]OZA79435.1 MAG: AbrB family transcriptional regulator [Halothiobacillus sp. 39-53-45]HQS03147.1 hypothetical protein [Halothiobacillus sp.]
MRTHLRKVGNSRGVIIPAALLAQCALEHEIDIRVEGGALVITPVRLARAQWFDDYQAHLDHEPLSPIPVDEDSDEWVW